MRDITFDIMKGIGILLMMIGHFYEAEYICHFIYTFHMPLFVLVAGYFSKTYNIEEDRYGLTMLRNNLRRLILPVVVTLFIILVWYILLAIVKNNVSLIIIPCLNLLWESGDELWTKFGLIWIGPLWFLWALFWAKTFFIFTTRWESFALWIALGLSLVAVLLRPYIPPVPFSLVEGFSIMSFFAIGWWTRRHEIPKWFVAISIACWLGAVYGSSMDLYSSTYKCWPIDVLGACGAVWLLKICCSWIAKVRYVSSIFALIGHCTLPILCAHAIDLATHAYNNILIHTHIDMNDTQIVVFRIVMAIAGGVFLAYCPYVKKIFT